MKTNQLIQLKRLQIKHIGNLILDLQKEMNDTVEIEINNNLKHK